MTLLKQDHEPAGRALADADLEALFREARRRQRRRWAARAAAAIVAAGCVVALISILGSGSKARVVARASAPSGAIPTGAVAPLRTAGPLAVAPDGALYVADVGADRVLVRLTDGRFRVIAGTGKAGYSGDGGPATRAELSTITDMAISPTGALYVADGGRVRMIGTNGLIDTVARIGGSSRLSIAFAPSGRLYISTGSQILRLTGARTLVPVRAELTTGPTVLRGQLRDFGPIAVDGHDNVYVSGVDGWAIWRVAPSGAATEVANPASARRSGGDYSVLERGPDGSVYGEDGPAMLRVEGNRLVRTLAFSRVAGEYFPLTYFAFAPNGTIYADDLSGASGFELHQQLIAASGRRAALLWEQR